MKMNSNDLATLFRSLSLPVTITRSDSRPWAVGDGGRIQTMKTTSSGVHIFGIHLDGTTWDSELHWTTADNLDVDTSHLPSAGDGPSFPQHAGNWDDLDDAIATRVAEMLDITDDNIVKLDDGTVLATTDTRRQALWVVATLVDKLTGIAVDALAAEQDA